MLIEFAFCQTEREVRGVNRNVDLLQHIWQRAEVIFVTVREDDRGDVLLVLLKNLEIGDTNVDAVHAFFRKAHTGIEHKHLVAVTQQCAVHSKLADTAEGNDFENVGHLGLFDSTLWTGRGEYIMMPKVIDGTRGL